MEIDNVSAEISGLLDEGYDLTNEIDGSVESGEMSHLLSLFDQLKAVKTKLIEVQNRHDSLCAELNNL